MHENSGLAPGQYVLGDLQILSRQEPADPHRPDDLIPLVDEQAARNAGHAHPHPEPDTAPLDVAAPEHLVGTPWRRELVRPHRNVDFRRFQTSITHGRMSAYGSGCVKTNFEVQRRKIGSRSLRSQQ